MSEALHVSPTELRTAASMLDGIRDGLRGGRSPVGPADPGWAATEALGALLALVHEGLDGLARRCADTAVALRVAADAYEGADQRAACRGERAERANHLAQQPARAAPPSGTRGGDGVRAW